MSKYKISLIYVLIISLLVVFAGTSSGCTSSDKAVVLDTDYESQETIYQVSSINLLLAGGYDGFVEVGELKKHGDLGLGTVDTLDGELVVVDGDFYTVKTDGIPYLLTDDDKIPFADVTFFNEDFTVEMTDVKNISEFGDILTENLPSEDIFYAVKFEGTFPYIKTRSVPKQEKPYQRLIEVVKDQSVFEYNDITGTVVGFWSPAFAEGMNVPGLHIHFISDDRTKGGHVLDLNIDNAEVSLDKTTEYSVILSETEIGQTEVTKKTSDKNSELSLIEK